jgi:anti-anti-sigma factor
MTIISHGQTLSVSGVAELGAANSRSFQTALRAALPDGVKQIEIDLSQTGFVDCGGVGALVALRNAVCGATDEVTIRLLNPTQPVQRIFSLTRMQNLFRIENENKP